MRRKMDGMEGEMVRGGKIVGSGSKFPEDKTHTLGYSGG